jgi:hypothetical protein
VLLQLAGTVDATVTRTMDASCEAGDRRACSPLPPPAPSSYVRTAHEVEANADPVSFPLLWRPSPPELPSITIPAGSILALATDVSFSVFPDTTSEGIGEIRRDLTEMATALNGWYLQCVDQHGGTLRTFGPFERAIGMLRYLRLLIRERAFPRGTRHVRVERRAT